MEHEIKQSLITLQEVIRRTGYCRDSIYRLAREGRMPGPVKVSQFASRWVEAEIDDYVGKLIAERDQGRGPKAARTPPRAATRGAVAA